MKNRKLRIHSIFLSIQGEGPLTGTPSVFLRMAGCNLRCSFCDTLEALNGGVLISIEELAEKILSMKGNRNNLVITGGEPLLQARALEGLLSKIKGSFLSVEVETNGTLTPPPIPWLYFNVSPKLSNSGIPRDQTIKPEIIREYTPLKSIFKFVVEKEDDLKEILEISNMLKIEPHRIYLMPMASSLTELENRAPIVANLSLKYGFRYSDRLHLRLSIP